MTDGPVVRVQRVMPARPDVVFDEWLDPEALMDWMCPRPSRCVAIIIEPKVGGRVSFDVDDSGSSVLITGQSSREEPATDGYRYLLQPNLLLR